MGTSSQRIFGITMFIKRNENYMDVPGVPYNVYMADGRSSRITWEEFKNIMETSHEWTYDPEAKEFYHMIFGARRTLEPFQLYVHAVAYGYYDDMSEYINDV